MIRGRVRVDISHYARVEPGGRHSRFLSREGAHDARVAILTATATLHPGAEVVIYVGRVRPCAEIDRDAWREIRDHLDVTFESPEPDIAAAWVAEASQSRQATA